MTVIIGIGTDLCSISRLEKACLKQHFYERVFLESERRHLETAGMQRAQSAAAMFAAKEAVAKALHTGFAQGVAPWLIEVTHDESGAPGALVHGGAQERLKALGGGRIHLSISHEGDMAMAFAVIETQA